jgi:peptidoglycan/LPS O-acetylase OafA/YrhL
MAGSRPKLLRRFCSILRYAVELFDCRDENRMTVGSDNSRIPELDGIRGIAIGMVVVYHYFLMTLNTTPGSTLAYIQAAGRLAWTGVDLFFVLSGFLIGGILIDARESSNYFKVFYARRFFRILPIYLVWFCCVQLTVLAIRLGFVTRLGWFLKDRLPPFSYLLFLQNFWMAARNNLGGVSAGGTWSLAIEEQFYLTIPALIWFIDVKRKPWAIIVGILTAPISRILCFVFLPQQTLATAVLMPCRADALLFGVLGAILWRDERWKTGLAKSPRYLRLLLLILIAGAGFLTIHSKGSAGHLWMLSIGHTWIAALYLCFLLCAITQQGSALSVCLRRKWLMGLGTIAYGVYLFHIQIRFAVQESIWSPESAKIGNVAEFGVSIVAILFTLLICGLSYVYFEKPLLKVGHRLTYK